MWLFSFTWRARFWQLFCHIYSQIAVENAPLLLRPLIIWYWLSIWVEFIKAEDLLSFPFLFQPIRRHRNRFSHLPVLRVTSRTQRDSFIYNGRHNNIRAIEARRHARGWRLIRMTFLRLFLQLLALVKYVIRSAVLLLIWLQVLLALQKSLQLLNFFLVSTLERI